MPAHRRLHDASVCVNPRITVSVTWVKHRVPASVRSAQTQKSLTNLFLFAGSGERNNTEEQHNSSLDTAGTVGNAAGLSLAQMSQMSFGAGAGGNAAAALGSLPGHSMHATKLIKESSSTDLEQQPQDSDLDDAHGHIHMQIVMKLVTLT